MIDFFKSLDSFQWFIYVFLPGFSIALAIFNVLLSRYEAKKDPVAWKKYCDEYDQRAGRNLL